MAAFVSKSNSLHNSVNEAQQNSTVKEDEIEKTLKLLEDGEKELDLNDQYRNVTLVLGITGSGKSAFVQWFAGDDSKLFSEEKEDDKDEYIIKDESRISNSTTESKTIIPELVVDLNNNAFYDCPGFSDTRSASIDIAGTYFVKNVTDFAQNVRLLLLVDHPSVEEGEMRSGLTDLLKHSTNLVKDVDKYRTSIALVVTKVNNFSSGGKKKSTEKIINSIGSFLLKVKNELIEKADINDANSIKLLDVLLQQNKNQAYSKIGIFRKPDQAGPLSEIPLLVDGKKDIDNIVRRLKFTPIGPNDFGYAISESSRKYVYDLANQVNNRVWSNLESLVSGITNYYDGIFREMTNKITLFVTASDSVDANPEEAHSFVTKYNTDLRAISRLIEEVTNVSTVKELAQKLNSALVALEITTCQVSLNSISKRVRNLEFLQSMSKTTLVTRPWDSLLKAIVDSLSISMFRVQSDINASAGTLVTTVNSTINRIEKDLWNAKLKQMQSMGIQTLPAQLEQQVTILRKQIEQKLSSIEQLAKAIRTTVESLDLETNRLKSNTLTLFNSGKYLTYLQVISDQPLNTWSPEWISPLVSTVKSLNDSLNWYRFLNGLYSKLGQFEFQQDPSRYNVNNLDDWGKGHSKTSDIQIDEKNFSKFLSILSQYNLPEHDKISNTHQVEQWQLNELNQMLSLTLKHGEIIPDCSQNGKLVISGDYVKFSDIKQKLVDNCPNRINSVNIFALKTIFVDSDLNGFGQKLKLTVMAPKWEVIGERSIDLQGSPAIAHDPPKANNAKKVGDVVQHGKAGFAGGSAGSYLGLSPHLVNDVKVYANGGVGGKGQNGGDGPPGEDGENAPIPTSECDGFMDYDHDTFDEYKEDKITKFGTFTRYEVYGRAGKAGGSGGNGGVGGIGGKPGKIRFYHLSDTSMTELDTSQGKDGPGGHGGIGGKHGRHGNDTTVWCVRWMHRFGDVNVIDALRDYKVKQTDIDNSSRAANGLEGANKDGITDPEDASVHSANSINEYKQYLRSNLNGMDARFRRNTAIEVLNRVDEITTDMYDSMTLADELEGLEEQSRVLSNKKDLINFYELFSKRVIAYAESPNSSEQSLQYKKMLNYLYTAALSKLYNLKSGSETNLIIDLEKYLTYVQDNMSTLNSLRQKHIDDEIVKYHKDEYNKNIQKQIDETNQFIESEITPEFDRISGEIDNQIDLLIKETEELAKNAEKNRLELMKKKNQMQNQLVWKGVIGVINIGCDLAKLAGPIGTTIGVGVGTITSLAGKYALDNDKFNFKIPGNVKDGLKSIETKVKAANEKEAKDIQKKIDKMKNEIKDFKEFHELDTLLERFEEFDKKAALETIKEFDELRGRIDETEALLSGKKDTPKKVLKALEVISRIAETSTVVLDAAEKFVGEIAKVDAMNDALKDADKVLQGYEEYRKTIYKQVYPQMTKLTQDLNAVQSDLGGKSLVALDVTNWKMQSMLKDVKLQMGKVSKDMEAHDGLVRYIEKLDEAMSILIKIYDRIQNFQQQQQLADFIANVNSRKAIDIQIDNEKLSQAVNRLEIAIRSNVVLQQFDSSVAALTQIVFPYARHYLGPMKLPVQLSFNDTYIDELVINANAALGRMKSKIVDNKTTISGIDKNTKSFDFDSTKPCLQAPFYVWSSTEYPNELAKLLAGEPVTLKADVRHSDPTKDAIKFRNVRLNFKAKNSTLQSEIDTKLEMFKISATHMGNSYYRYGGKYYVINHEFLDIGYSFANSRNGKPIESSDAFDKIQEGTLTLSPYAMWNIRLAKMNQTVSFDQGSYVFANAVRR